MLTYEKIEFYDFTQPAVVPEIKRHVIQCPQCRYTHAVPVEYMDWKVVAERYKAMYERMVEQTHKRIVEAGEQFNVPLLEYLNADWHLLRAELQRIIDGLDK